MSLDLDAIEARANAATAGPWLLQTDREKTAILFDNGWQYIVESEHYYKHYYHDEPGWSQTRGGVVRTEDATFIAHAREDVSALITEVRRLRAAEAQSGWEVRPAEGQFDEVVASNVAVHFEMMDTNALWVGITLPNGETHHLNVTARGALKVTVEENV